jgi:hemerythrin-like domain-containing protein
MAHPSISIILKEHASLVAVLRVLVRTVEEGPQDAPLRFFDLLRAMLFYIDQYPERLHHPKESDLLFPKVARARPDLMPLIQRLEADHMRGESDVRELQHLLLTWEMMGQSRHQVFQQRVREYASFYVEHMRLEEQQLLPVAAAVLTQAEWAELDRAFSHNTDPLDGGDAAAMDRIFTRVLRCQAPFGATPG